MEQVHSLNGYYRQQKHIDAVQLRLSVWRSGWTSTHAIVLARHRPVPATASPYRTSADGPWCCHTRPVVLTSLRKAHGGRRSADGATPARGRGPVVRYSQQIVSLGQLIGRTGQEVRMGTLGTRRRCTKRTKKPVRSRHRSQRCHVIVQHVDSETLGWRGLEQISQNRE